MGGLLHMPMIVLLLLLLIAQSSTILASPKGLQSLYPGISLNVEDGDFLVSPNRSFSSGFLQVGDNAYCFSIWFTNSANKTPVWMANRDNPVNGKGSQLTLSGNGNLVLTDSDGTLIWSANTNPQRGAKAEILENGNLVLMDKSDAIIWESFDSPTDTLLPTQNLTKDSRLVSILGSNYYSSGFFYLHFSDDNVLYLTYNSPDFSSIYWPDPGTTVFDNGRNPYNSTRIASFDDMGIFISSDNLEFNASDLGLGPKRRLTLDYDGILRMYSLDESNGLWDISFVLDLETCSVHGICGLYGVCTYDPSPTCSCPSGFKMTDQTDWSKGCSPIIDLTCNPLDLMFLELHNTDFYGNDLVGYRAGISLDACRNSCLHDCQCNGFGFALNGLGQCFPKQYLFNGINTPDTPIIFHVKVPSQGSISMESIELAPFDLECSQSKLVVGSQPLAETSKNRYVKLFIGFVIALGVVEVICIGLGWWYVFRKHEHSDLFDMGYLALAIGFKRFTYAELMAATANFQEELGKGGFGTVYKGVLDDDRIIAVKRLEGVSQGEAEFWAEVSTIGRINHMNLVKLWGYCAEGKHKLLVYEYLENGSLDKNLSSNVLDWNKRFDIALGTAKGLSYLHEECLEWVLHCDVKPQNILLDTHFQPKVADFGMSKLVGKDGHDFRFSKVRGTRGYLAPDWMMNLQITAKADVYSYGIVLLELVTGKSPSSFHSVESQETEKEDLVKWIEKKMKEGGVVEVVDPRLNGEYDIKKVERLVSVALMCARYEKDKRPAMSEVVELLLKDVEGVSLSGDSNDLGDEFSRAVSSGDSPSCHQR